NDIVEVIGSYFPLKRAGANFKALCPFHQEKTPSFHVSPQRQTFHCFGCGVGGSVFRFVMDYEHIDFPSAVRKLAARVGIPVIEERGPSGAEDRQNETRHTLLQLHGEAAAWFHENLLKKEFAEPARKYLRQRGITVEIAKRWQLGYAPDEWDAFGSWASGRGYNTRDLIASGLIEASCAIVCEGQLDLISLFEAGITNVVAPQGTAFTESQARLLKRFVNEVVLCFDEDAAGKKATERSLDALLQNDLIVRVAEMPTGEDPDSLVRREGKTAFEKRIADARDFFDYWIERETANVALNSLSAKMEVARTLA